MLVIASRGRAGLAGLVEPSRKHISHQTSASKGLGRFRHLLWRHVAPVAQVPPDRNLIPRAVELWEERDCAPYAFSVY